MKVKWQCTGPHPSSGEGEVKFSSDKAYTTKATLVREVKGKPETTNIEQAGHWVGADCGTVRPAGASAKP